MTQEQEVQQGEPAFSMAILKILEEELPSFFSRDIAAKKLNGIFTKETLSNFGPNNGPPIHYWGRRVFYIKEEFLEWMVKYFGGMDVEYHGFGRRVRVREDAQTGTGEGS